MPRFSLLHCGGLAADPAIEVVYLVGEGRIIMLELKPEVQPSR